jgi:isocitrate/isopropylmalate dehydrogenase
MMLEYLNFSQESKQLHQAVVDVYRLGRALTRDQGGKASTTEFCTTVIDRF